MYPTNQNRLDDMLQRYGDIHVAHTQADYEKMCLTAPAAILRRARHVGECHAQVLHDSYFVWNHRASNTFKELKQFVCQGQARYLPATIHNWADLQQLTIIIAREYLARVDPPALPCLLPREAEVRWWQYMAIIFECERQRGEITIRPRRVRSPLR